MFRIEGKAKEDKVKEYKRKNTEFSDTSNEQYPVTVFFMNKWTR